MKRFLSLLLVSALIITIFSGCTKTKSDSTAEPVSEKQQEETKEVAEKIKIKVMLESEDKNRQILYQDYYSKNILSELPHVEAEFELPGSSYANKLTVYNASGTLPDVFWGNDVVYQSGNAMPLMDKIKANGFYEEYTNKDALIPAPDGEIYCLSSGTDSFFAGPIFYNKAIFDKEGLTMPDSYDGFVELVRTLKEKGYLPISATGWALQNFFFADLMTVDDPNTMRKLQTKDINFDDQLIIDAANRLQSLYEMGAFPENVTSIEQQVHEQLFLDGNAAMIYHPIWIYPAIKDATFDIEFAFLPEVFGNNALNAWGSATSGGFMVSNYSEHPNEALEVAQFLVMQDAFYWPSVAGNATAIKGHDELPADAPDVNRFFYDKILSPETNVIPNFPTNYLQQAQQAEYITNLEKLIFGQFTPEEFCNAMKNIYK